MVDRECPYFKWISHHYANSSFGEAKCLVRNKAEWGEHADYRSCNSNDHNSCLYFLRKSENEKLEAEEEREEIIKDMPFTD